MYGQNLKGESLQLGKRQGGKPKPTRQPKPFLPLGQLCGRTGCAVSVLQGFRDLTGQSPEQAGLTSQLTLTGARV